MSGTCWNFAQIDNLSYSYQPGTNRVSTISDAASATYKAKGFNPGAGTGSYAYDVNGNPEESGQAMTSDPYKAITIAHNHLNLPRLFTWTGGGYQGNSVEILCDAAGTKLRKTVKTGATVNYVQDYIGGIEYRDNVREAIYTAEGRVFHTSPTTTRYEYTLKDHLVKARLSFSDLNGNGVVDVTASPGTNELLQENHYYPVGLGHDGPWVNDAARDNRYQYNGKEWNDDFGLNWYNYGKRWYDAAVGRFPTVDPIASDFAFVTRYNYAENNSVNAIDLHGLQRYLVINSYVNQQLNSTTISTVKSQNGDLVNLMANNGNGGTIPSAILAINRGDLPYGINQSSLRDNFTTDETSILNAGVDAMQSISGDLDQGLANAGGFSFPGSFPSSGETFIGEAYIGKYENVQTPVFGSVDSPLSIDVAQNFGFTVVGVPNYRVTGIQDLNGQGTNAIINQVENRVNGIIGQGGKVNSIDVRATQGSALNAQTSTAISSYVINSLLPRISNRTGISNVNFTFNGNVNNTIKINGSLPTDVQIGTQNNRVLKP